MKSRILTIAILLFSLNGIAQTLTNPYMQVLGKPSADYSSDTTKLDTYQLSNMSMMGAKAFYNVLKGMDEFSLEDVDLEAIQTLKTYIRANMNERSSKASIKITVSYKVMLAYDSATKSFTDSEIAKKEQELLLLQEQVASANKFRNQALDLEKANRIRNRNSAMEVQKQKY